MSLGQFASAQSYFEEGLVLSHGLGEKVGVVDALQNLAQLMIAEKNYEAAGVLYEESLDMARDLASAWYMLAAQKALERLAQIAV